VDTGGCFRGLALEYISATYVNNIEENMINEYINTKEKKITADITCM